MVIVMNNVMISFVDDTTTVDSANYPDNLMRLSIQSNSRHVEKDF